MVRYKIKIENGRIELPLESLEKWANDQKDGAYLLGVKKWYKKRSNNQNDYYWGVVIETLCDHTGYTPEEMHDCLKRKFLAKFVDDYGFEHIQTTKVLTTTEMEEYLERVKRFSSVELQCYIPDPKE
jgi:hypothetical protein